MITDGIGGYFELELPNRGGFLHDDGVLLNSGRNALEYVMRSLKDVCHLWIPFYTCEVVLEPLAKLNISYSFYHIDHHLELLDYIDLREGDYLLYTNYFGIKDEYVRTLANQFGSKLIVDNAQALYAEPIADVNTFYSPRKYVGVPDGGIAYCLNGIDSIQFAQDYSHDRCSHLLKRIDLGSTEGYTDFRTNSKQLVGQPIKKMSKLTQRLLCSIDFAAVKSIRKENFAFLHSHLKNTNFLEMPKTDSFACPMVYPYLTKDASLKQRLISDKVFVATYWPNVKVWAKDGLMEMELAERLIPIPCDQRYNIEVLQRVLEKM